VYGVRKGIKLEESSVVIDEIKGKEI